MTPLWLRDSVPDPLNLTKDFLLLALFTHLNAKQILITYSICIGRWSNYNSHCIRIRIVYFIATTIHEIMTSLVYKSVRYDNLVHHGFFPFHFWKNNFKINNSLKSILFFFLFVKWKRSCDSSMFLINDAFSKMEITKTSPTQLSSIDYILIPCHFVNH